LADVTDTSAVSSAPSRGRRIAPLVAGLIAVAVAALFWVLAQADPDRVETSETPLIGQVAPASVGEMADGRPFELSRRKGSWVVLNFFSHNCVPCIREHPELITFHEQQQALGVDGAELYTIVRDSTQEQVEDFFAERGGDWPVVYDTRYEFVNDFGVALVPETWIIDPNGVVRNRFISEVTAEGLGQLLQQYRTVAS
jgi:cytochrome c biogenesis protein CcmG/thiol:disulfide interchange protein DsbE